MITTSDETWATTTLRDAQDPGGGIQWWMPLTRLTLERYNLIFSQVESRGYANTGQPQHDAASVLEAGFATLLKVVVGGASDGLGFTKWSVASGLELDDIEIVPDASISDTARPSMEVTAGDPITIMVFYVDEDDDYIHSKSSDNGGSSWGAEGNVGDAADVTAIASTSTSRVHWVSYGDDGNSRFHVYDYNGSWSNSNSLIYWPHEIEHIDAITIGDRDLIVFYSDGPMYGNYRTAGIYGCWYSNGRWSDFFPIDVLDEATDNAYRKHPMISQAGTLYFLTGFMSEGDSDYSHTDRFVKVSKDGDYWSQRLHLVCAEGGPAMMLVVNAASGQSWPWSTGQQVYMVGFDKIYESDATRFVGEINTTLQVDISSRVLNWKLARGVISQATTVAANHDGGLDNHSIINEDNTLLLKREAGYYTSEGAEFAQLTLEEVDVIKETDRLPQRHKQVISRDRMKWMRDNEADHFEERESQLVGYDNYHDNTVTAYGGLSHTATQHGWWETHNHMLWLRSNNEEGLVFATWDSQIMNGQVKAMIRLESASNDEYAGVVFRARDADNYWAAYYDQTEDKILLRRKTGGEWQGTAAESAALSWSVDTWYGIMVDFRYSYFRVFYSTDGKNWTQAFTHVAECDLVSGALEYGYTGLIGYGYCDEDSDEDALYEPDPSPLLVNPLGGGDGGLGVMAGAGGLVYFLDDSTGRLFRTRNAFDEPADVVYEDLGVIDASVTHFALAKWDPINTAMACGSDGIWRCLNLDDDSPSWTCVVDLSGSGDVATYVCASPKRRKWWMVWGYDSSGHAYPWVRTSQGANGTVWTREDISDGQTIAADDLRVVGEMSSHDINDAWAVWHQAEAPSGLYVCYTANGWGSFSKAQLHTDLDTHPIAPVHAYRGNRGDLEALYCGREINGASTVNVAYGDNDYTGLSEVDLGTSLPYGIGAHPWSDLFWCLFNDGSDIQIYTSEDRATWTSRISFTGVVDLVRDLDLWPHDVDIWVVAHDGTDHPIKVSSNQGYNWSEQTGNWGVLGYDGNIGVVEFGGY